MVGDNDAGAFATYGQAGQNYGTTLLWTLALLIPVLYVNQEMVLRLGAVTGVGHARLIFERFGKFWGAFSVIDLFLLNALTIVTEFIGIALALDYLGLDKTTGVIVVAGADRGRRSAPATSGVSSASRWCWSSPACCSMPDLFHGPSAVRASRARLRRSAISCGRQAERRDAAHHRHRRHDGRALAAVLPAELRHRQAHHPALHSLRAPRSVARHRAGGRRRRRDHGLHRGDLRGPERVRQFHRRGRHRRRHRANMSARPPA